MATNTLITGPTHGIGRATAIALASRGHKLFLLCRSRELGLQLCREIESAGSPSPVLLLADLGKPEQIRSAAQRFFALEEPLHMLINNAGIVNFSRELVDIAGTWQEKMFAVNHLGHFLLTQLLLPQLIETGNQTGKPSRIIIVSSEAHAFFCKGINYEDITLSKNFGSMRAYGQSKLANILMTRELASRLDPKVVLVNCLHPGTVNSNFGMNNSDKWYATIAKKILGLFFISPEKGAETTLHLATSDINTHGAYYSQCKQHRIKPWGLDVKAAKQLWDYSVDVLKLKG